MAPLQRRVWRNVARSSLTTPLVVIVCVTASLSILNPILIGLQDPGIQRDLSTVGIQHANSQAMAEVGSGAGNNRSASYNATRLSSTILTKWVQETYNSISTPGPNNTDFVSATTVASAIQGLLSLAASQHSFRKLNSAISNSGDFTLQLGGSLSTGITNAYFVFTNDSQRVSRVSIWDANLSSSTLTGPLVLTEPNYHFSVYETFNWAGWSYWGPSSPTLESIFADISYPTTYVEDTTPLNPPSGGVSQVVAAWVGLTDSAGYVLQTGLVTNTSAQSEHDKDYGVPFFELACSSDSCPSGPVWYGGDGGLARVSPGDNVAEEIRYSGPSSVWRMEIKDYTSDEFDEAFYNISSWGSDYDFKWTDYIVEAPTYNGTIQQLPHFTQVNFYDIQFCENTGDSCWGSYNMTGDSNIYYISQWCAVGNWVVCETDGVNTHQIYHDTYGGHFDAYGFPDVEWESSGWDDDYILYA